MIEFFKYPIVKLTISLLAVFAPIQNTLLTLATLVIADVILGVLASRKLKRKIKRSSLLRRSFTKGVIYGIGICLAFLTQQYLTGATLPICSIVSSFAGLSEFVSILENLNILSGGSLLTGLIDKLTNTKVE